MKSISTISIFLFVVLAFSGVASAKHFNRFECYSPDGKFIIKDRYTHYRLHWKESLYGDYSTGGLVEDKYVHLNFPDRNLVLKHYVDEIWTGTLKNAEGKNLSITCSDVGVLTWKITCENDEGQITITDTPSKNAVVAGVIGNEQIKFNLTPSFSIGQSAPYYNYYYKVSAPNVSGVIYGKSKSADYPSEIAMNVYLKQGDSVQDISVNCIGPWPIGQ